METLPTAAFNNQYEILQSLNELSEKINIREIKPILMYYMAHQEKDQANDFLVAYQQYHHALEYLLHSIQNIS